MSSAVATPSIFGRIVHYACVVVGAVGLTLLVFLVLPLLEAISQTAPADTVLLPTNVAALPPPPPPPEPEQEEEEPEEEEPPPQMQEEAPPLDLSQLELALDPGIGDGALAGDFAIRLSNVMSSASDTEALFSIGDLDQEPRVVYQTSPSITAELRRKTPATVYVIFVVEQNGRVSDPKAQSSTDPAFEKAAIAAVRQWRFEPGKRAGQAVRFRMRVPITFPKS